MFWSGFWKSHYHDASLSPTWHKHWQENKSSLAIQAGSHHCIGSHLFLISSKWFSKLLFVFLVASCCHLMISFFHDSVLNKSFKVKSPPPTLPLPQLSLSPSPYPACPSTLPATGCGLSRMCSRMFGGLLLTRLAWSSMQINGLNISQPTSILSHARLRITPNQLISISASALQLKNTSKKRHLLTTAFRLF